MDLAASGINPKQVDDLKDVDNYMEPLMEFMAGLPAEKRVVLVGHSMGGVAVAVAMEHFPKKIAVGFNFSLSSGTNASMDIQYAYDRGSSNPSSFLFGHKNLATRLYQNSPTEDLELANTLVRPSPNFTDTKSIMEVSVTKENYGLVHRVFIMSGQDKGLVVALQKYMIENNPPNEVKKISDSDHMVMFSKPKELCSYLLEIAAKYN
ncbi:hypothetical protein LguiB_009167 [Lonicera macranthoides]